MAHLIEQPRFLVAVVGPTGTGKTNLSVRLAEAFMGEIINVDSRQFYRCMDIGTAKPTQKEMEKVPHHLFDFLNPDETFSLGEYLTVAKQEIEEIQARSRIPFLVGGTGQYVRAILEGWSVPKTVPDRQLREKLEKAAAGGGAEVLHKQLRRLDPVTADNIDRRNIRRMVRAIEVATTTGVPFSKLRQKQAPGFRAIIIGLTADRATLYERLDARVEDMMRKGLVRECQELLDRGYDFRLPAWNSIGYKQIGKYLTGEIDYEEAVQQIKFENHRLVRHQYAWFRLNDRRIHWFDIRGEILPEVMQLLADRLSAA